MSTCFSTAVSFNIQENQRLQGMIFSCLFNKCTIRQRVITLNIMAMLLIMGLIGLYSYQVMSLERNLLVMEQGDDLFNHLLELRRHEKNIMLQLGTDNIEKTEDLLETLEEQFDALEPELEKKITHQAFVQLHESFIKYQTVFNRWCAADDCQKTATISLDSHLIRNQGQELLNNAAQLVRLIRQNASQDFKQILFWITFVPIVVFLFGAIVNFVFGRGILTRLASLQKATKNLAAGEFKPIETIDSSDEISTLIINFNQMVEALEQKQEELLQSKKMASIGTFSSGIAHEINNPLNNISLSTDALLEEFSEMSGEEIKEILDDIMAQTERASKIVRNLLDFSRAQSSEMQPFHIDFIIHKTTDLIANELKIHNIVLQKKIPDLLPRINGDLQKLQQVFLNLIINAEQAIGTDGMISVITQATDDGYIRTDIIDTGPGIAPEHLEQIFDPFFTTKEAGKGTGLGLSIVYGIVKKHGGFIEVSSKIREGTKFSVYLPIYQEPEEREGDGP